MRNCNFTRAQLAGANLKKADMQGSLIDGVDMRQVKMQDTLIDVPQAILIAHCLGCKLG